MRIDLNADAASRSAHGRWASDAALLAPSPPSTSPAAFHAGDPDRHAPDDRAGCREAGLAIGAHPAYRTCRDSAAAPAGPRPRAVEDLVLYQVAAARGASRAPRASASSHVKPHGALYNQAARDAALAAAMARAVAMVDPALRLVGSAGSRARSTPAARGRASRGCRRRSPTARYRAPDGDRSCHAAGRGARRRARSGRLSRPQRVR